MVPLVPLEIVVINKDPSENIQAEPYFLQLFPGKPISLHIFLLGASFPSICL
jgi:hypothetical protein